LSKRVRNEAGQLAYIARVSAHGVPASCLGDSPSAQEPRPSGALYFLKYVDLLGEVGIGQGILAASGREVSKAATDATSAAVTDKAADQSAHCPRSLLQLQTKSLRPGFAFSGLRVHR